MRYVYECPKCGVKFERVQRVNDPAVPRCPQCHKGTPRRVMQPVSVMFRGRGFYSTDHKGA